MYCLQYLGGVIIKLYIMQNHPIPVSEANAMTEAYRTFLKENGIDPDKQTQSVSFTAAELMNWLNKTMGFADELRICLGVYPVGHVNAGRITTILWPYKDGKPCAQTTRVEGKDDPPPPPPTEPYNAGGLNP